MRHTSLGFYQFFLYLMWLVSSYHWAKGNINTTQYAVILVILVIMGFVSGVMDKKRKES